MGLILSKLILNFYKSSYLVPMFSMDRIIINNVNINKLYYHIISISTYFDEASRGAGAQSMIHSPLEEMKYLLKFSFPFLRSGVEAKSGVKFCHSTRNASRIRQKMNGVS